MNFAAVQALNDQREYAIQPTVIHVLYVAMSLIHGKRYKKFEFHVLLTVHLITIPVNNQLDAQFFPLYLFIPILYMFRATKCSSSGESIVSLRPLVYEVSLYVGDRVVCSCI